MLAEHHVGKNWPVLHATMQLSDNIKQDWDYKQTYRHDRDTITAC